MVQFSTSLFLHLSDGPLMPTFLCLPSTRPALAPENCLREPCLCTGRCKCCQWIRSGQHWGTPFCQALGEGPGGALVFQYHPEKISESTYCNYFLQRKGSQRDSSEKNNNLLNFCLISMLIRLTLSGKTKLSMSSCALYFPFQYTPSKKIINSLKDKSSRKDLASLPN